VEKDVEKRGGETSAQPEIQRVFARSLRAGGLQALPKKAKILQRVENERLI
jgi:hypothetical protein